MAEVVLPTGVATWCTHYAIGLAFGWAKFVQDGVEFLAQEFGAGPNDERIVAEAWASEFAAACCVAVACWVFGLEALAGALA